MHLRYTNESQEFLLPPRFNFPRANVVATKQSEHFPTSSVSHKGMRLHNSSLNDGHWPVDASQPDNPNAFATQTTFYTKRNSATNMVRSDLQYGDGRTGFWPVLENPPHRQDVSISTGSEERLDSHENASYCATGWSAASHIPIATSGVQLFTTRNYYENDAPRTSLGVSSGNNCISQDALTYSHAQRHHPDPYLVERASSNHPQNIQFLPHPRPTTRRSYKPPVTTSPSTMVHQWDWTHPSAHVMSHHTQRLTYTADSFYLDTAQNKSDNSNQHSTYLSRQTMAPYVSYNPPFTGSSGHHQELGTNSSHASTSNVVGTLPGSRPEDATGSQEPGPDPAPASVFLRKRRLDRLQDVDVNVDPRTVQVSCGWHGCQVAIYPHRMDVKYHLVEAHKVLPGGGPITCAHPTCGKEIKADSMWQHWITHLGVRIQCTVCHATVAPRTDSFKRHFLGSCRGDGRFIVADDVETCKDVESAMQVYSRSKKLRIN